MLNSFFNKTTITFKVTTVFLLLIISISGIALGARAALAANLKSISIVNDNVLRVSDIFDGVTRNADYVIGAAPQPGQDMTLNARTLYRIAISLDLPWRPASSSDSITVRREATVITPDIIEDTIRDELANEGFTDRFTLRLSNNHQKIILPKEMGETVELKNMSFNSQNNNFRATMVAPSLDNPLKTFTIAGSVERMIEVPVLVNPMKNGEIISNSDIDWIEIPERKLQHNVIMSADDIIGMTPRRIAYAGKLLQTRDIERPNLVKRGENVLITFKDGPLVLTTKGKAMQSGAKGDLIRVTNMNSHRNVDAFVTGENQVLVQ